MACGGFGEQSDVAAGNVGEGVEDGGPERVEAGGAEDVEDWWAEEGVVEGGG